jgi:hypothetical protein
LVVSSALASKKNKLEAITKKITGKALVIKKLNDPLRINFTLIECSKKIDRRKYCILTCANQVPSMEFNYLKLTCYTNIIQDNIIRRYLVIQEIYKNTIDYMKSTIQKGKAIT